MDNTVIDAAVKNKFSEFSSTVKSALVDKLSEHPTNIKYKQDFDSIERMKQDFANINI